MFISSNCYTISLQLDEIAKTNAIVIQLLTISIVLENVRDRQYKLKKKNEFSKYKNMRVNLSSTYSKLIHSMSPIFGYDNRAVYTITKYRFVYLTLNHIFLCGRSNDYCVTHQNQNRRHGTRNFNPHF